MLSGNPLVEGCILEMGRIPCELYASHRANPEDRRLDMKNRATSVFTRCLGALGPDFNSYSRSNMQ